MLARTQKAEGAVGGILRSNAASWMSRVLRKRCRTRGKEGSLHRFENRCSVRLGD